MCMRFIIKAGCDKKMKAAIYTLGCKVNQYESEEMTEMLTKNGYLVVNHKEDADVYIVNSCTVTAESNRKTRQAIRKFKVAHPDAVIVMTGCVPQAFPDEALAIKEADIILGNKNNRLLIDSLNRYFIEHKNVINITDHKNDDKYTGGIITEFSGHTRAFVKIQDGCNRFCSYCAIPYARGRSRSKSLDDVKTELNALASNGFREVVFVGINLSAYGRDIDCTLADAVVAAQNTDGIERIRLGSLEPDHISDEMIDTFASCSKFCPQFHISLQSGCDTVLKRMNRHYNSAEYAELVSKLRRTFSDTSITTDIITGFPGETAEEFNTTVEFAKQIRFEKVHVFPYSIREGTKAAKMEGQILNAVKSERASTLADVCEELRADAFKQIKGRTYSVLFEAPKNGYQCGYTKNYTPVMVKTNECLTGIIKDVVITEVCGESCIGELI